jgi:polysaccharide biosynthesis transport protein
LSPVTEGFRNLRTNLEFASVDRPIRTLQITSTGPSEGKSTLAVNLAAVIAQSERKVLLIDADLRRPSVHKYLAIPNRRGLVDLFRRTETHPDVIITWGNPPFQVITSGEIPPNPTELLASDRMTKILDELKETVDIIVIDSPPSVISDPIALSAKVDGVLVVIEPGKTTIGGAQVMMEQLKRSGARVIGAVLNPISRRNSHYYTKYHYYSSYYYRSGGYNQKEIK